MSLEADSNLVSYSQQNLLSYTRLCLGRQTIWINERLLRTLHSQGERPAAAGYPVPGMVAVRIAHRMT
jgi:hypothetical protein